MKLKCLQMEQTFLKIQLTKGYDIYNGLEGNGIAERTKGISFQNVYLFLHIPLIYQSKKPYSYLEI